MHSYSWPGNVRELQNMVKRAVLLAETPLLEMKNFGAWKSIRRFGEGYNAGHSPR
jgi:Transcriptional regulator containing PAS, AAA-type ATPase, and DNA-binding domains